MTEQTETDAGRLSVSVMVGGQHIELGAMTGTVEFTTQRGPARREGETDEQYLERIAKETEWPSTTGR